jgi:hypothetical protein
MLLHETEYINDSAFSDLKADLDDIRNILGSICKTTEANA